MSRKKLNLEAYSNTGTGLSEKRENSEIQPSSRHSETDYGCNQNYIAEIERASSKFPKPETIDAIAAALNIRVSDLFIEEGCPKNSVTFDKERFTKEVITKLSDKLEKSMIDYLSKELH